MGKLIIVAWIACGVLNYGLSYAGIRKMSVRDWPLTMGSRPVAYRDAVMISAALAVLGPTGLGGVLFLQTCAGFPGWHVTDWQTLSDNAE
jgi:hypothetical protein